MEISKVYDPASSEDKWYSYWLKNGFFRSVPDDREPYTIVIPPPNVTGVLHMGHMLNNTLQDVLIRRARMQGKNACWVPGTDHASIATEAKVVALLREQGIKKSDLSREEFLKHAYAWKDKYGGIILEQLKKLGASCDWERTSFTMDEGYYRDVIRVFIDLHKKGYIYRGVRMVNWDPVAKTALSDEEVIFKPSQSKLYHVRYRYAEGEGYLTVATVRPETIMGDVAIAVHPEDERYKHLHGKKVIVPLVNRPVPVITDEAIDMAFGTGCLKVTPAHDAVDYEIGQRHQLPQIDVLNEDGTISEAAGIYVGLDRFEARKKAVKQLQEDGLMEKVEEYANQIGHSERTDAVIEPRLSMQWFLSMKEISKPALEAVLSGEVQLIPGKFVNTYRHWMENVRDWCLSRQLWWGHRIPAWYVAGGEIAVAENLESALADFKQRGISVEAKDIRQDEDVLDTWASSWLWPISVFNGLEQPDNPEIKYYYPTNELVTAPEILFFWVARMIIAGYEYRGQPPFRNVYLTGIVRDKLGRKMSKSLGNSPDPLELMRKYSADGVRIGMLLSSPAGNDLLFDESQCEQGRNFANKIWNAFRLLKGWTIDSSLPQPAVAAQASAWFKNRLNDRIALLEDHFAKFRMSDALMTVYKLVWDDFCSWYLEMIKPEFGQPIDELTMQQSVSFFDKLLKLMHPFMPFITEEIYQQLEQRAERDSICVAGWPEQEAADEQILEAGEESRLLITAIREFRAKNQLSPKQSVALIRNSQVKRYPSSMESVICKLANLSEVQESESRPEGSFVVLSGQDKYYVLASVEVDREAEKEKVLKELEYTRGFLEAVEKKLSNEKFVQNAKPEVLANEQRKKEDALRKIRALEDSL